MFVRIFSIGIGKIQQMYFVITVYLFSFTIIIQYNI